MKKYSTPSGVPLWHLAAIVTLTISLLLLSGCGAQRAEQYRQQGDTYLSIDKLDDAVARYQAALSSDPKNARAKLGLARIAQLQQKPEEAATLYREAIALDSTLREAYSEGAVAYLRLGKAEDAEALANELASRNQDEGGLLLASVQLQAGNTAKAIETLSQLRAKSPNSIKVRVAMAMAYLADGQPSRAEEELKTALTEIPDGSTLARMALVDVYESEKKLSEMVAELQDLVNLEGAKIKESSTPAQLQAYDELRLTLARSLLSSGRIPEAEEIARPILQDRPDSGWANFVVGSCLLESKRYAEALPYLQTAARILPEYSAVQNQLANARSGGRKTPTAQMPSGDSATAQAPTLPESGRPEGSVDHTPATGWRGLWEMAALEKLVAERDAFKAEGGDNFAETILLSAVLVGNMPLAEQLAAALPAASPLHAYLEALKKREPAAIVQSINAWQETDPAKAYLRDIARAHAMATLGARMQALSIFSECMRTVPENVVPLYALGGIYTAAQMPEFAQRCFQKILVQHPNNAEVRRRLFSLLLRSGQLEEARSLAESSYAAFPSDKESILNLVQAYLAASEVDLAQQVAERGIQTLPNEPLLSVPMAAVLIRKEQYDDALALLDKAPALPETAGPVLNAKATAASLKGDWADVLRRTSDLSTGGQLENARMLRAAAFLKTDNVKEAAAVLAPQGQRAAADSGLRVVLRALGYEQPVTADQQTLAGKLTAAPAGLADLLCALAYRDQRLFPQAFKKLTGVIEAVGPDGILIRASLDTIASDTARTDPAGDAKALLEQYPNEPSAWLGLAEVYKKKKDNQNEFEALSKALSLAPDSPAVLKQACDYYERTGDMKKAEEGYRKLLSLNPNDPAVQNNLAYMILTNKGSVEEALSLASAAQSRIPDNPNILHTLGLAQLRAGKLEEGQKSLQTALEMRPADPTLLLDFGQLLVAQGREADGKQMARLALIYSEQLGLEFARRAEAEALVGKAEV